MQTNDNKAEDLELKQENGNGESENEIQVDPETTVKNEIALLPLGEQAGVQKFAPNNDILRINEISKKVKSFKKRFPVEKFALKGIDDKAGEEKLAEARRELRKYRLDIGKELKEKTKPLADTVKFYNSKYKPSIEAIEEIEAPLKELDEKHEKEKEEAKQAEAKALENRVNKRVQNLIDAGATFDGSYYAIADAEKYNVKPVSLGIVDLQGISDPTFENILRQVADGVSVVNAAKETEKLKLEEEENLRKEEEKKQKQRLIDDQAKLVQQQQQLAEEMREMKRARLENRGEQLLALGLVFLKAEQVYRLMSERIDVDVPYIENTPASEWNIMVADLKNTIKELNELAAEQERMKNLVLARYNDLQKIGMKQNNAGIFSYEELSFSDYFIKEATEGGWQEAVEETSIKIKAKKEATEKRQQLINTRTQQLIDLGMRLDPNDYYSYEDLSVYNKDIPTISDEKWDNLIDVTGIAIKNKKAAATKAIADKAIADEQKRKDDAEILRQEELAKRGDKAKWEDFISHLKIISFPVMISEEYQRKVDAIRDFIFDLK